MDKACDPGLVAQLFRGTIGNFFLVLGNNWIAGQRESGEISKWVRSISGVSLDDISKYGLQGGENSVVNQVLGGEKSFLREAIKVLDPTQWELPTIPMTRVEIGPIKFDLPKL
jgi:hypothetical protein